MNYTHHIILEGLLIASTPKITRILVLKNILFLILGAEENPLKGQMPKLCDLPVSLYLP